MDKQAVIESRPIFERIFSGANVSQLQAIVENFADDKNESLVRVRQLAQEHLKLKLAERK